jgi:CDP-diacylglycerol--serine O-phosphatidyltransferase
MFRERMTPRQWASARLERLEDRLERLEDLSISKVIPSALTLLGLCAGITTIRFVLLEQWKGAVIAIFCAMVFDMLDGRAARWLGADSRFGAQLDSLADLVSFGVAPTVIAYTWCLWKMGDAGWIAAVIFCACSAIRLARFNIQAARDEGATHSFPYFTGLPTPAAACVMLLPLLLEFQFGRGFFREPIFSMVLIALTSVLMVSRVPTPSLKHTELSQHAWIAIVIFTIVLVPFAIYLPWATFIAGICVYLAAIPFVIVKLNGELAAQRAKP